MNDCSHSQSCYQRTFIVVIAFVFVLCIGFALMFNFILERQNKLVSEVQDISTKLDALNPQGINDSDVAGKSVFVSKKLSISPQVLEQLHWERVSLKDYNTQFFYPQGYTISGSGLWMSIYPVASRSNPSPAPVMNIRVLDNSKNVSLEQVIYQNFDRSIIHSINVGEVNGLPMREVAFREVADQFGTCQHYILGVGEVAFDLFLHECLVWEHFDEVMQTFMSL